MSLHRVVKEGDRFRVGDSTVVVGARSDHRFEAYTLPLRINGAAVLQTGTDLTALVNGCSITARPRRGLRARLVIDGPPSIPIRFGAE